MWPYILIHDSVPYPIPEGFDIMKWMGNQSTEKLDPITQTAIDYARKELKATYVGGVGYCFGARVGVDMDICKRA
jgi:dienelactone hydrolase